MLDTHTHSWHSPDGTAAMARMAAAAEHAGLDGLAFTDHAEWYPGDEAYGYLHLPAYFAELEALRARHPALHLLAGVELGNPQDFPAEVAALLAAWPFDVVIGSVHWMDDLPGWEPPFFSAGLDAAYERYFAEVSTMVSQADYDVLGHLDLVRRDSWSLYGEVLPLDAFRPQIERALRGLIARGKGLEINTSGMHKGQGEPLPSLPVLRWYRELGGEILVFGSDGHHPTHVGYGFAYARALALEAGFTHLARYEQRRVVGWLPLDGEGG